MKQKFRSRGRRNVIHSRITCPKLPAADHHRRIGLHPPGWDGRTLMAQPGHRAVVRRCVPRRQALEAVLGALGVRTPGAAAVGTAGPSSDQHHGAVGTGNRPRGAIAMREEQRRVADTDDAPDAWNSIATAALLRFHGCRIEAGADRGLAGACCSSSSGV